MFGWLKRRRREAVRRRAFPAAWRAIIEKNVPYAAGLSLEDRQELLGHVQVFLAEKHFEGCGGLSITDEVRVTIAAQACVLLLHRQTDYYPRLVSILVYPSTYLVPGGRRRRMASPMRRRRPAWANRGRATWWSWPGTASCRAPLTSMTGTTSCCTSSPTSWIRRTAPATAHRSFPAAPCTSPGRGCWATTSISSCGIPQRHHRTLIDRYGATSPAEFFAVVTETFFEKPRQLRSKYPELYLQLQQFYRQDPAGPSATDRR